MLSVEDIDRLLEPLCSQSICKRDGERESVSVCVWLGVDAAQEGLIKLGLNRLACQP